MIKKIWMKEIDHLNCILQFSAISIQLFVLDEAFNNNPYPIMGTLAMLIPKKWPHHH
jgi:hypothetical protein